MAKLLYFYRLFLLLYFFFNALQTTDISLNFKLKTVCTVKFSLSHDEYTDVNDSVLYNI